MMWKFSSGSIIVTFRRSVYGMSICVIALLNVPSSPLVSERPTEPTALLSAVVATVASADAATDGMTKELDRQ